MKTRFFLIAALAIVAACAPKSNLPKADNRAEAIVAAINDPSSKYVVVASHRGDWRNYPENSIPAIESVIRMGVDIMELDLKMTKDSVLVLCHDKTLNRTTTGKGPVSDYTYEEIQQFDLKRAHGVKVPGMKMPTLREALAVCKDRIVVNVDQGYQFYDQVLEITEELGVTDQILIKGSRPWAEVKEKLDAHPHNMMYMPIISGIEHGESELFQEYMGAPEKQLAYELCFRELNDTTRAVIKKVYDSGAKVWINTIWASLCGGWEDDKAYDSPNPGDVYDVILDLGTSMIQTDRPEFLIKYLESKGRR